MNSKEVEDGDDRGGVGWILLGLIGVPLLVLLALPNFMREPRGTTSACINNLRQIDGAKQTWALENNTNSNATPTWENIKPYIWRGTGGAIPKCPEGGHYTIGKLTVAPTCSIKGHVLD